MNPSRKTQCGEDLKMQFITNVVAQLQALQSELDGTWTLTNKSVK